MNEEQAIRAMLQDPVLIRRPLIEVNGKKLTGFNIEELDKIGVNCNNNLCLDLLKGQDLEGCLGHAIGMKCDEPRTLPKRD